MVSGDLLVRQTVLGGFAHCQFSAMFGEKRGVLCRVEVLQQVFLRLAVFRSLSEECFGVQKNNVGFFKGWE